MYSMIKDEIFFDKYKLFGEKVSTIIIIKELYIYIYIYIIKNT